MEALDGVRADLKKASNKKVQESFQRFFKNVVKFWGVKSAEVRKIANDSYKSVKSKSKSETFEITEELFSSGYSEEASVASNWVYKRAREFEKGDIKIFEKWIDKYINDWAKCDTFCNHSVGAYIEKFPQDTKVLKNWAKSRNLWLRRASAVSLIAPARKGDFLKDIFEIADILLLDTEDMVQKGYGWMLKVISQTHQKKVFEYVMENKKVMPRTALRYAIEKMPQTLRKRAMEK